MNFGASVGKPDPKLRECAAVAVGNYSIGFYLNLEIICAQIIDLIIRRWRICYLANNCLVGCSLAFAFISSNVVAKISNGEKHIESSTSLNI